IEGYPSESTADFSEGNVSDLVYAIIGPVLSCLRRNMGRDLRLWREKEIVSVDGETGGNDMVILPWHSKPILRPSPSMKWRLAILNGGNWRMGQTYPRK
ncbi:hypothetical protein L211DRAFT_788842, partial [Terfezia boudieri ATCC MYA-4762]